MNKTLIILSTSLIMIPIFVILADEGVLFGSASASTTSGSSQSSSKDITTKANIPLDIVGVIASSNNNGTNNSTNAADGKLSTRWSATGQQWIEADLGSKQLVIKVDISWRPGPGKDPRVYSFDIYVINDEPGKGDYVDLDRKGINSTSTLVNQPDGFAGNRIRINGHGNSLNDWNSIQEIQIWGSKITSPSK